MYLLSGLFPLGFPKWNFICISYLLTCATWAVHPILVYFVILIIIVEYYKFWSSSLCSFVQRFVTLALLGSNILLSTLFSNTSIQILLMLWETQVSHLYIAPGCVFSLYISRWKDSELNDSKQFILTFFGFMKVIFFFQSFQSSQHFQSIY
jgi:hypothetical protein